MKQDIYKHLEAIRDLCTEAEAVSPELFDNILAVGISTIPSSHPSECSIQVYSNGTADKFIELAKQALHIHYSDIQIHTEQHDANHLKLWFDYRGVIVFTLLPIKEIKNGLE